MFEVFGVFDFIAEKLYRPWSRCAQAHNYLKKSGFAAAVGRNQAYPISPVKFKIQVIEHCSATRIAETDVLQIYDWGDWIHTKWQIYHQGSKTQSDYMYL